MTMPSSHIKTSDVIDRLVMIKQCPVTGGLPTKMTESGFAALCARQIENAGGWKYNYGKNKPRDGQTWCQVCRGEQRPKELQLVDVQTLAQLPKPQPNKEPKMATKKVRGVCEGGCGQTLQLSTNYGVKMCSTCGAAHSHVKNHAETVVAAIRRTGMLPWYVEKLVGETVTAQGESATLDAISAAVGYEGESPDGLVGAVRACVEAATGKSEGWIPPDVIKALGLADVTEWSVQDFELAIIQQAAQLDDLQHNQPQSIQSSLDCVECDIAHAIDVIRFHTGTEGKERDQVVLAVAQAEAILEALGSVVGAVTPIEIVPEVAGLAATVEQLQQRADERFVENRSLADRVSELERVNLANEQIFAQLRELVDAEGLTNAQLPSAIRNTIHASCAPVSFVASTATNPNIDTPLLDLALDAMRGDIKGLTPDRIAALRGGAQ